MLSDSVDPSLGRFVDESLTLLAAESPEHFDAVHSALGRLRVRIALAGETSVSLGERAGRPTVEAEGGPSDVEVSLSSQDLLRILDGDETFEQAVLDGRVLVRGRCDAVLAFDDALRAWAHGAMRAPSFSPLLQRLKTHYAQRSDR